MYPIKSVQRMDIFENTSSKDLEKCSFKKSLRFNYTKKGKISLNEGVKHFFKYKSLIKMIGAIHCASDTGVVLNYSNSVLLKPIHHLCI